MPLRKVHELTFLWFGLPGPLLTLSFLFVWVVFLVLEGLPDLPFFWLFLFLSETLPVKKPYKEFSKKVWDTIRNFPLKV